MGEVLEEGATTSSVPTDTFPRLYSPHMFMGGRDSPALRCVPCLGAVSQINEWHTPDGGKHKKAVQGIRPGQYQVGSFFSSSLRLFLFSPLILVVYML